MRVKNFRKIYLIFLVLTLFSVLGYLFSTPSPSITDEDRGIIDIIKEIEITDHKFSHLELTTADYLDSLSDYFIDEYTTEKHFERVYGPSKGVINNIDESYIKNNPSEFAKNVEVQISKPYSDFKTDNQNWKLIFTKSKVRFKDSSDYIIVNKRYTFKSEGEKLKVLLVETDIYFENSLKPAEITDLPPDENKGYVTKYDKYDNRPVDYSYSFTINTSKK